MRLKVGDSVKVKKGILCPDEDTLCIGGWQGRIFEIEDDTAGIRWDSITLQQMPHAYIKKSEKEGLGWTEMYLGTDEIEPASPRDTESEAERVADLLESKYCWLGREDAEDQRIYKVVADADEPEEAWHEYLSKQLTFPFEAQVYEPQDRGHFKRGDKVMVHRISDVDDHYGILVDVTQGRKRSVFPLCDLEVLDKKSKNYTPVKDYCVWFANR